MARMSGCMDLKGSTRLQQCRSKTNSPLSSPDAPDLSREHLDDQFRPKWLLPRIIVFATAAAANSPQNPVAVFGDILGTTRDMGPAFFSNGRCIADRHNALGDMQLQCESLTTLMSLTAFEIQFP